MTIIIIIIIIMDLKKKAGSADYVQDLHLHYIIVTNLLCGNSMCICSNAHYNSKK